MKQFYDSKIRPNLTWGYTDDDINRICLNCNKRFGLHFGYECPDEAET